MEFVDNGAPTYIVGEGMQTGVKKLSAYEITAIKAAYEKRQRKNARRLKNRG
jgi:hypothetical protein